MSFIYNSLNSLWNTTTSYFPETVKYCAANNINLTTTTNLAKDVALLPVFGTLAMAKAAGEAATQAASQAADAVIDRAPALAHGVKDLAAKTAFSALQNAHAWQFGKQPVKADAAAKDSVTMVAELAGAAGNKLLDLGYSALKSGYAMLADKTAQLGAFAWSEVKVQAPALGGALLGGVEYVASKVVGSSQDGQEILSTRPLNLGALDIQFAQDDVLQFSDLALAPASNVLPSAQPQAFAAGSLETYCIAEHNASALQEQPAMDECVLLTGCDNGLHSSIIDSSMVWNFV